jgi:hypothetical protein
LWEQKLEGMIRSAGGVTGFGGASSSVVSPGPVPGPDGPGSEPVPPPIVEPDPSTPRLPASPSVFAAIGGLSILWTGLDSGGFPFPAGTKVQVHVSATASFTPSGSTQRGLLNVGERIVVTDLISGTTYYIKFVTVAPDGQIGEASAEVSSVAGFVLSTNIGVGTIAADMVSFDATAIGGIQQFVATTAPTITNVGTANQLPKNGSTWINTSNGSYYTLTSGAWVQRQWDTAAIAVGAINTLQIATGAITADSAIIANAAIKNAMIDNLAVTDAKIQSLTASKLSAGTIDASVITVNNLNAGNITTGTLSAERIDVDNLTVKKLTSDVFANPRVVIGAVGETSAVSFKKGGTSDGWIMSHGFVGNDLSLSRTHGSPAGTAGDFVIVAPVLAQTFRPTADVIVFQGYRETTTAGDVIMRLSSNVTSTNQAKFEVDADGDVKSRTNSYAGFSDARYKENIEAAREYLEDLRDVEVVTFNWQGSDQKLLGVTAQQIQPIFPNMVAEDEDGTLSVRYSVFVPMLITAVQSLADRVDDLTARVEALES